MNDATKGTGASGGIGRFVKPVALSLLFVATCALLLEIGCQAYARLVVFPRLESRRESPRHYYRASEDPVLGYELRPDIDVANREKRLHINRYGIRADDDDLGSGKRRIAILGDSVAFGVNHSQEKTISGLLQRELDPTRDRILVLDFSVGGYGLDQLRAQLEAKDRVYDVADVVYLLNFNDYARHDSIYEGADNGLYRTYQRPVFMTPFFLRKAVYRLMKGDKGGSVRWYRWLFEGNEAHGREVLASMARYAREAGIRFRAVLLPSGLAYTGNGYELQDLHDRVAATLRDLGVPVASPVEQFGRDRDAFYDETDHFHEAGNREMARLIADFVGRTDAPAGGGDPTGAGAAAGR